LEPADPWKDGLMPKALETYKYMQEHLPSEYREEYEYLDGWASAMGPTDTAGLILSYDKFLEALYLSPEKVHQVMKITTENTIRFMKAQEQIGGRLKRFLVADDIIGLMSPKHFQEFSLPYLKQIFDTFSYAIGIFHCDANTTHLLEDIPQIGMNVFNFGPEIDIKEIKNKIGNRVGLLGNLPPISIKNWLPSDTLQKGTPEDVERICKHLIEVGLLARGTPQAVEREVKEKIESLAPGGGYILTSGNSIASYCRPENVLSMIKTLHKYG